MRGRFASAVEVRKWKRWRPQLPHIKALLATAAAVHRSNRALVAAHESEANTFNAVSYTHLTLPTICSV